MKRIKSVWTAPGVPAFPDEQVRLIEDTVRQEYSELCESFWLFRFLHRVENADCTLLGDYCFGIFSGYLAELDSVPLNDAFSAYLKEDTVASKTFDDYLQFVSAQCGGS